MTNLIKMKYFFDMIEDESTSLPVLIKIGRQVVRKREQVDPEAKVLQDRRVDADTLDDAILEPTKESLRARWRRPAYAEVVDKLGKSDLDDE